MNDYLKEQWIQEKRLEAFGDASALHHYRFEKDNGRIPQLEQARRYAQHWKQMYQENLGMLFWGKPGNGKTFAAASIANALLEQEPTFSVKMTTFGTILNKLPGLSPQDKEWYLAGFRKCDLLILDDFGMERQTEYAREQVFSIIDSRYLSKKPLIITTNLSLQELKSPTDLAQQRIYDRILELCIPVCFDGESLRHEKSRGNLKRYLALTA